MALQSTTFLDIVNNTASLTYTLNSSQVDEITYSSNSITFSSISSFNLMKSDAILYSTFINVFLNLLLINFPSIQNSRGISLPLSSFEIQFVTSGIEHIYYIQTSNGNSIYDTNYVPIAQSASFSSRSSITITLQEFLFAVQMLTFYSTQVSLN